jgi:hypothetical protein
VQKQGQLMLEKTTTTLIARNPRTTDHRQLCDCRPFRKSQQSPLRPRRPRPRRRPACP